MTSRKTGEMLKLVFYQEELVLTADHIFTCPAYFKTVKIPVGVIRESIFKCQAL